MKNRFSIFIYIILSIISIERTFAQLPTLVKDINIGNASSTIEKLCITENGLFFSSSKGNQNYLWYTDGTDAGTFQLHLVSSIKYTNYIYFNGVLYYSYNSEILNAVGADLWRSDGTSAGTFRLKDHVKGNQCIPSNFVIYNNKIYYSFVNSIGNAEIWTTDGSASGTYRVLDLGNTVIGIYSMSVFKNEIYFIANSYIPNQAELRKTNGTPEGTSSIKTLFGYYSSFYNHLENKLYFTGYSEVTNQSNGLWVTDGTEIGTKKVVNARTNYQTDLIRNKAIINYKDTIYFSADLGDGHQIWKTDGTFNGTNKLSPYNPIFTSTSPGLTVANNLLFFHAINTTAGQELYKSDGTNAGTVKVDYLLNKVVATFQETNFNNLLYFTATDRFNHSGKELWVTDGKYENTRMVIDLLEGSASSNPSNLTANENQLFFSAGLPNFGHELCVIDKRKTQIERINLDNKLKIFPNPNQGLIYIPYDFEYIIVYNTNGQLILKATKNENRINLHELHNGNYLIQIFDKSDKIINSEIIQIIK